MTRFLTAVASCALVAVAGAAQRGAPAPAGTAELSGVVRTDPAGSPAAKAMVLIAGTDVGLLRVTVTDAAGRFTFAGLPAGRFLLAAGKPAYLSALYGAGRVGRPGTTITVAAGQTIGDVTLALAKGAVIAGRLTDENGQAVVGARVRVLPRRTVGEEIVLGADAGDPANATTDDTGGYRIFDLIPGDYVVAVQPRGFGGGPVRPPGADFVPPSPPGPPPQGIGPPPTGAPVPLPPAGPPPTPAGQRPAGPPSDAGGLLLTYSSVYFPATSHAMDAEVIHVEAGEERLGVDLRTALVPLARVEGVVTGAPGPPLNVQILLRPSGQSAAGTVLNSQNTRPGPDGRFAFANVAPGTYDVLARTLPPPNPGARPDEKPPSMWALDRLTIAGAMPPAVALRLQPALTLGGRIVFGGLPGPPDDIGNVRVGIRATPASAVQNVPDPVLIDRTGRFTLTNLTPGRYRLFVAVPPNNVTQVPDWFPKSAVVSGRDVLDLPLEIGPGADPGDVTIVMTDDAPDIAGVVRDGSGKPAPGATVIVFPSDSRFWFPQSRRIAVRQAGMHGEYVFGLAAALPPGDYRLAVVSDLSPGEQFDSAFLSEAAKTAMPVVLADGDSKTIDLRVVSAIRPR
ncbi:MAG TPA: carboxypeptidase-like regulatory domain-containing protein [Vicinamibacterales bacterium]|nr:carboxypeptidase-like regulatory domain-containing protein [Vicinamibacterales bacterium]